MRACSSTMKTRDYPIRFLLAPSIQVDAGILKDLIAVVRRANDKHTNQKAARRSIITAARLRQVSHFNDVVVLCKKEIIHIAWWPRRWVVSLTHALHDNAGAGSKRALNRGRFQCWVSKETLDIVVIPFQRKRREGRTANVLSRLLFMRQPTSNWHFAWMLQVS